MKTGYPGICESHKQSYRKRILLVGLGIGEVQVFKPFMDELRKQLRHVSFSIGVTNRTGLNQAKRLLHDQDDVFFLPLDYRRFNTRLLQSVQPDMIVFSEHITNPDLLALSKQSEIPSLLINAAFPAQKLSSYRVLSGYCARLFDQVSLFHLQSAKQRDFLTGHGITSRDIRSIGNLKAYSAELSLTEQDIAKLRRGLGFSSGHKILVAGSVHSQEERVILDTYSRLKQQQPDLKLIIAPRHPPSRAQKILAYASEQGLDRATLLSKRTGPPPDILIVDTRGDLHMLYSLASVAFIGGSLVKRGGHNIFEAANFGVPVVTGPHCYHFQDTVDTFVHNNALTIVQDADELYQWLGFLLRNPNEAAQAGVRAKECMLSMQDALHELVSRSIGLLDPDSDAAVQSP